MTEKKEQLIGVKNTTSSDAARSSGTKHTATKEGTEKMVTTSDATLPSISVTKCWDSSTSSKAVSSFVRKFLVCIHLFICSLQQQMC